MCDSSYRWVPYNRAASFEQEAAANGVSDVARSSRGFLRAYQHNPNPRSLCQQKVPGFPNQIWGQRRSNFIHRHMVQYRNHPTKRRWLALMMWAFEAPHLHSD